MKRYCCEKFESQVNLKREQGLNIRIIKVDESEVLDKKCLYRFFITPGYQLVDKGVPTFNIAFCPFCGQSLFNFYKTDEYINEEAKDFLYL